MNPVECKKTGVINRQYSPSAIAPGDMANRSVNPGITCCRMKTTTLIPRIPITTGAVAVIAERTFGALLRASATHSGQC
jgi:hypothetical protein